MSYYRTNAVYEALSAKPRDGLVWVSGNAWLVLHADRHEQVKSIAMIAGASVLDDPDAATRARLKSVWAVAKRLAEAIQVPLDAVRFDDRSSVLERVTVNRRPLALLDWKEQLAGYGLPVDEDAARTEINHASSSAYHTWQRDALGAIKVADVDLIRVDGKSASGLELIELKRSFITLEHWRPYPDDYPNFNLILDVATRAGARMTIAYNRRLETPSFDDDASLLSLFDYPEPNAPQPLGQVTFEQFAAGAY